MKLVSSRGVSILITALALAVGSSSAQAAKGVKKGAEHKHHGVVIAVNHGKKDPSITIHTQLLLSQGLTTQAEIDQMDAQVMQEIEAAVEFARQSPYPDPSELFEDMFANPIPLE